MGESSSHAARKCPVTHLADVEGERLADITHLIVGESVRVRAASFLASRPRPFLRWAGSKRVLLPQIVEHLPKTFGTYYEPFLGAGSLFFLLQPSCAVLGDLCAPLVSTYEAVRDNAASVLRYLSQLRINKKTYYKVRAESPSGRYKGAANFLYLNLACWNGLYRVSARGNFNVPYGRPRSRNLHDYENIKECSRLLNQPGIKLENRDFEQTLSTATRGDLVYLDPPYVTGHNNNGFRDYNEALFSWDDQIRLARLATRLAQEGVSVVVSNALHADIKALYSAFSAFEVSRKSTLAGDSKFRGRATESLFVSLAGPRLEKPR